MAAALLFAGASAALDLMGGLFGYLASKEAASISESRGRMIRMEAESDAQRYSEQARGTRASQRLAFLKAGVELSGSPLDFLDSEALTAQENISAIRARGRAGQVQMEGEASQARIGGRAALLSGISSATGKLAMGAFQTGKVAGMNAPRNDTSWNGGGTGR